MRTFVVVVAGLVLFAGQADAGKYFSAAGGFSIKKPRGWAKSSSNALTPAGKRGAQLNMRPTGGMPLTKASVAAVRTQLTKVYSSKFRNFRMEAFYRRRFGPNKGIYVRARFRAHGMAMVMSQAFIRVKGAKRMLIITCTVDARKRRAFLPACERTYPTARFGRR